LHAYVGVFGADKPMPASAVLDLGALVDAIHVASGAHLELQRLHIPNSGNRKITRLNDRLRLHIAGAFALWPSVTVAKNSMVHTQMPSLYGFSSAICSHS
jgi:hypothetical protein